MAIDTCVALGQGRMTFVNNAEELKDFFREFQDSVPLGMCRAIWTPFSDEEEEGSYTNLVDKTTPTFFPWARGQPNGAHTENGVSIRWNPTSSPAFFDQNEFQGKEKSICAACSLAEDFSLTLWGACKDTLIGKYDPTQPLIPRYNICDVEQKQAHHLLWLDLFSHRVKLFFSSVQSFF